MKMRLFYEDELRRKSYNEMYQIAVEEKLVDIYLENPTREELINLEGQGQITVLINIMKMGFLWFKLCLMTN